MKYFARACLMLTPAFLTAGCATTSNLNTDTCQQQNVAALFSLNGPGVRSISPSHDCMNAKLAVMFLTHPNATHEMVELGVNYTERLNEKAKKMVTDQVKDYDKIRDNVMVVGDATRKNGCEMRTVTTGGTSYGAFSC